MPLSTSTSGRLIAALCAVATLTSCMHDVRGAAQTAKPSLTATPPSTAADPASESTAPPPPSAGSPAPPPSPGAELTAGFQSTLATLPAGDVGVAIFDGQHLFQFGGWISGAAWSTIKVPLSIAALRADPEGSEGPMRQAISYSDNAAADQMWHMLGDPYTAAAAMEEVLREGGDTTVAVQPEQIRPPYSPYGQTDWSNEQAAIFAFNVPCITGATPVLDQMHNLDASHRWGLASFADVAAKGGWGPEPDGGYLVRQVAVVTNRSGTIGVSLAVEPADGSMATGTAMLDSLGAWIDRSRNDIAGGLC